MLATKHDVCPPCGLPRNAGLHVTLCSQTELGWNVRHLQTVQVALLIQKACKLSYAGIESTTFNLQTVTIKFC